MTIRVHPSLRLFLALLVAALFVCPTLAQRAITVDMLWSANCAACHGDKGQGGSRAASLLKDDLLDQDRDRPFFDTIKSGHASQKVEGAIATLSNEEAWALVNYLREFQAQDRRRRVGSISRKLVNGVCTTSRAAFAIEDAATAKEGLDTPWSIAFAPQGFTLVTNRPGSIVVFDANFKKLGEVAGLPKVRNRGQGGLMDVTLHPDFAKGAPNDWVYLTFADEIAKDGKSLGMTKIIRGHVRRAGDEGTPATRDGQWTWTDQQTIFEAKPEHYLSGDIHFGCKIVFDPKDSNLLFFGIGERGHQDMAQDLTRPNGKIHRLHADGSIPRDNPFADRDDATYKSIWSFGHRNPQGLAFDLDGRLWDTEHAPRGGDELNLIRRGGNFGWPLISFGINYNGTPFRTPWPETSPDSASGKDLEMPVLRWMPSIAACGLEACDARTFPDWRGDLLAGGLAGACVERLRIDASATTPRIVEREEIVHGLGRVRDIANGPDGNLYLVLNGPDRVVRLAGRPRPAK